MSMHADYLHEGERLRVELTPHGDGRYTVRVGDRSHEVTARRLPDGRVRFVLGDEVYEAAAAPAGKGETDVTLGERSFRLFAAVGGRSSAAGVVADGVITAPMTGTVLRVLVKPGQSVAAEDTVAVLSAMKMEHKLHAGIDGTVAEVVVAEGATVDQGELLLRIEP